jgi:NAD(P)H-dependent FMN reductase
MLKVAIIIGSTRPNRVGGIVGDWVEDVARKRDDAEFTLIDLLEVNLPLFDESLPPLAGQYHHQHTKDWAATVARFDAFLFVTGEYNHSIPAALKNAIDFVHAEWNNKAAGFISYGADSGIRAVEQLRNVMAELQVATVREQVKLNSYTDFESFYDFHPTARHEVSLNTLIDQVVAWGGALATLR